MRELGYEDIRTEYDEALAAAIFYIFREYNSSLELGMELFKSRCQIKTDNSWKQNALLIDIGGGTTDIALLSLTLTEEQVFDSGEP
jgi:hypothetical protein